MFTVVNSLFNKVQSPDITKDIHQQSNDRITDVYVSTAKESEVRIHAVVNLEELEVEEMIVKAELKKAEKAHKPNRSRVNATKFTGSEQGRVGSYTPDQLDDIKKAEKATFTKYKYQQQKIEEVNKQAARDLAEMIALKTQIAKFQTRINLIKRAPKFVGLQDFVKTGVKRA